MALIRGNLKKSHLHSPGDDLVLGHVAVIPQYIRVEQQGPVIFKYDFNLKGFSDWKGFGAGDKGTVDGDFFNPDFGESLGPFNDCRAFYF
jgi:hypothetical protein